MCWEHTEPMGSAGQRANRAESCGKGALVNCTVQNCQQLPHCCPFLLGSWQRHLERTGGLSPLLLRDPRGHMSTHFTIVYHPSEVRAICRCGF